MEQFECQDTNLQFAKLWIHGTQFQVHDAGKGLKPYHCWQSILVAYAGGFLQQSIQPVVSRKLLMMARGQSRNLLQGRGPSYPGATYYQVSNPDETCCTHNFHLNNPHLWENRRKHVCSVCFFLCSPTPTMDDNTTLERLSKYNICHCWVGPPGMFIPLSHLHQGLSPTGMSLQKLMIRANCWPSNSGQDFARLNTQPLTNLTASNHSFVPTVSHINLA